MMVLIAALIHSGNSRKWSELANRLKIHCDFQHPAVSPHFSPNQVHWGGDSERIVLQPRFFLNPQDAPMLTECSPALFDFLPVEGRQVVASFDGGAITSDAGALLLGQTDRALRLTERFASCFADTRTAELVEHQVETMVMQRVVGIALGYEDLN